MHDLLKHMGLVVKHKQTAEEYAEKYRKEAEAVLYTDPKRAEVYEREHVFWAEEVWILKQHLEILHKQIQQSSGKIFPKDLYA